MGNLRLPGTPSDPSPLSRGREVLRARFLHLFLALVPAIVLLCLLEIGARVEFRWKRGYPYSAALAYLPHRELVYQSNPDHWAWRTRPADRFRGFFIPPLEDDRPRLWVLGGSTSEARPDAMDWPSQLQAMLPDWRVVNMGHSGYGTSQILRLYRQDVEVVKPTAVIIFSGWNYRGAVSSRLAWRPPNTWSQFDGMAQRFSATLMNWSTAYGRAWHLWERLLATDSCRPASPLPPTEFAAWVSEYRQLIRLIQKRHAVFVVLFPGAAMYPDPPNHLPDKLTCLLEGYPVLAAEYARRSAAIERLCADVGVRALDVRPAYRRLPSEQFASYFEDPLHQTPAGNAHLAQTLYTELQAKGLRTK